MITITSDIDDGGKDEAVMMTMLSCMKWKESYSKCTYCYLTIYFF